MFDIVRRRAALVDNKIRVQFGDTSLAYAGSFQSAGLDETGRMVVGWIFEHRSGIGELCRLACTALGEQCLDQAFAPCRLAGMEPEMRRDIPFIARPTDRAITDPIV